ncbi:MULTISPECIES: hypothetical protein [unclassified Crossiella]|uniref:helix-turn-helix domain-containing protein n=1 Tax=unclassified Crossiella TaxID=2620835 RepID=UPI001FFEFDE1|nr:MULTISPECIES: hypothetical protein [unclassified Crossiella]MCK2240243.1 hypothetical protein [Crossiella sp. S99.2]MCK2253305.1 hypothetical protein [Crossiella sp. S99.1]
MTLAVSSPDLTTLLRTGPFPAALRAAIQASGLSLDRVQHRLRARGATVSVATLSNWQSGRRQPERDDSFVVLGHLEAVLGLPEAALRMLVGPPRPRGRHAMAPVATPTVEQLWSRRDLLGKLLSTVDTSSDELLTRLSQHDLVEVGRDGRQQSLRVKQVLRADADGADRWLVVYDPRHPRGAAADLVPLRHCRVGNLAVHPDTGLMAAELLFDEPLSRGETVMMEFEIISPAGAPPRQGDLFCRKFRRPVRDYLAEVRFHPEALPQRAYQVTSPLASPTGTRRRALTVSAAGSVHATAQDVGPGTFAIRWDGIPHP